jgi:hypothetical protein
MVCQVLLAYLGSHKPRIQVQYQLLNSLALHSTWVTVVMLKVIQSLQMLPLRVCQLQRLITPWNLGWTSGMVAILVIMLLIVLSPQLKGVGILQ